MISRTIKLSIAMLIGIPTFAAAAGTVQLPATGQTSCFNATGSIACTGTSGQDGDIKAGLAWPTPRFADNLNGTMTDNLTGLIWSKHANAPEAALGLATFCTPATPGPENDMTWPQSIGYINCLNGLNNGVGYLGFNDWRLPNVNELESMVNAEVADTAISFLTPAGFVQAQSSQYWTSTTDASNLPASPFATLNAWDMDLAKGQSFSSDKADLIGTKAVWPVRGVSAGPAKIWRTGQDVCFDLAGDPIPCVGTGQDGEKLAGAAWPVPRFMPNAGATLALDRVTGLVWATSTVSPGPAACAGSGLNLDWQQALTHVACLNTNLYLGRNDWRLPNRKELRSLVDYSRGEPALPAAHPFTGLVEFLRWSSTTDAFVPSQAWTVNMLDGTLSGSNKAGLLPAWPVSGPDLVAPVLTINPVTARTNKKNQAIAGTMEAGATVDVKMGATTIPVTVNGTGTAWNAAVSGLAAGANSITVTSTNAVGNVATQAATITFIAPDGLITGGSVVNIGDALKALRIAVGIIQPTLDDMLHGDVAPMGAPDDRIDAGDALLILKKSVGLPSF